MLSRQDTEQIYAIGAWLLTRDALSRDEFESGIARRRARIPALHEWIASGHIADLLVGGRWDRQMYGEPSRSMGPASEELRVRARYVAQSFPDRFLEWRERNAVSHLRSGFTNGWCLREEGSVSIEAIDFIDGLTAYGCRIVPVALDGHVLTVAEARRRPVPLLEALLEREVEVEVIPSLPADVRAGLRWYYGWPQTLRRSDHSDDGR